MEEIKLFNKQQALDLVYVSNLCAGARQVMAYLINRSNSESTCFPSIRRISEDTSLSRRTVQRKLRVLEELNFITCEARTAQYGRKTSNLYKITIIETLKQHSSVNQIVDCESIDFDKVILNNELPEEVNLECKDFQISVDPNNEYTPADGIGKLYEQENEHDGHGLQRDSRFLSITVQNLKQIVIHSSQAIKLLHIAVIKKFLYICMAYNFKPLIKRLYALKQNKLLREYHIRTNKKAIIFYFFEYLEPP